MKILIELNSDIKECEVLIRCDEVNEEVQMLQKLISESITNQRQMLFYQKEKEFYLPMQSILFFETTEYGVSAHTLNEIYQVHYKLYELEDVLPAYFMRISKSTILNTKEVYSITRSLTSSSLVEFKNTIKQVYVSRNYYKPLKAKLDERNLR